MDTVHFSQEAHHPANDEQAAAGRAAGEDRFPSEITAEAAQDTGAPEEENAILALNRELTDMREKMMRALAEAENARKRAQKESADAKRYAVASFARDLLVVFDDLRRCASLIRKEDSAPKPLNEEVLSSAPENTSTSSLVLFREGIELILRSFEKTLEQHGLKKIEPQVGDRFDPNLHEALFQAPNPEVESGTIIQVEEVGYMISDRLLRPARVGISS